MNFSGLDLAVSELMNLTDAWYAENVGAKLENMTEEEVEALYADRPPDVKPDIIPGTLPYSLVAFERYSEIPDDYLHILNVSVVENQRTTLSINIPTVILAGNQLTLDYVPANADIAELANVQEFLNESPAYLYDFRPVLMLNSIPIAVGEPSQFGAEGELQITVITPNSKEVVSSPVTVGNYYAIGVDLGKMPSEHIERLWNRTFEGIIEGGTMVLDHNIGGYMSLTLSNYFGMLDISNDIAADALGVRWWRNSPAIAVFGHTFNIEYVVSIPTTITEGYSHIDVIRNILSIQGRNDMKLAFAIQAGSFSSIWESKIFELFYNVSGISTANILEIANQNGIPIYYLNSGNIEVISQLDLPEKVRESIFSFVNNGYEVYVPSRQITRDGWTGVGWLVIDPATGASAWMLSDELGTIINGGSGNIYHGQETVKFSTVESNKNQQKRVQEEKEKGVENTIKKIKDVNPEGDQQINLPVEEVLLGGGIYFKTMSYVEDYRFASSIKDYVDNTLNAIEYRRMADIAGSYGDDFKKYIDKAIEFEKAATRAIKNARAQGALSTGAKVFNKVLTVTGLGLIAQKTADNVIADLEERKYFNAGVDFSAGVAKGAITGAAFYADIMVARKVKKIPGVGKAVGPAAGAAISAGEYLAHKIIDGLADGVKDIYGALRYE
jgi:hypothetical protein